MSAAGTVSATVVSQLAACRAHIAPPATLEDTIGLTFSRGDRVVDLVTGQEGVIVRGERQATLAAAPNPQYDGALPSATP